MGRSRIEQTSVCWTENSLGAFASVQSKENYIVNRVSMAV